MSDSLSVFRGPRAAVTEGRRRAGRLLATESRLLLHGPDGDVLFQVPWSHVQDARVVYVRRGLRSVPSVEVEDLQGQRFVLALPGRLRRYPLLLALDAAAAVREAAASAIR